MIPLKHMQKFKYLLPFSLILTQNIYQHSSILPCKECNQDMVEKINPQKEKLNINRVNNETIPLTIYNQIMSIVEDKLGEVEVDKVRNLYDVQLNLKYYCLEFAPTGYFIYDIEAQQQIEYSKTSKSPYLNQINQCIYIGPLNYYMYNNVQYYSILEEKTLTLSQANKLSGLENNLTLSRTSYVAQKENEIATCSTPGKVYFTVPYYYYFKNAVAHYMTGGTTHCGFIATELLLGYYDSYFNDNFIPEAWDYPSSDTTNDFSTFEDSPGVGNDYVEYIIKYANDILKTDAINCEDTKLVLNHYFQEKASSIDYELTVYNSIATTVSNVAYEIRSGNPVIVNFRGYSADFEQYINHAALAYIVDKGDIYVNWGWGASSYNEVNVSPYTMYQALSLKYKGSHVHSNNYIQINNDLYHTYLCPCGNWSQPQAHQYEYIVAESKTIHVKGCGICKKEVFEVHAFYNDVCVHCNLDKNSDEYTNLPS